MFTYLDSRFAHNLTLLFHCANVCLRHAANQAVALRVKSQPGAFAALNEIVTAPDFRSKLLLARQNPKGTEAQQILNKVVSFVNAAAGPPRYACTRCPPCLASGRISLGGVCFEQSAG